MKSKLTLHIMNWDPPDKTNDVIARIQPRVIKVMDSGLSDNKIEDARRLLPEGAIVVGRVFFDNPPVPTDTNLETYNPTAAAHQTFDAMRQDIDKMGWRVDVWEGWNEYPVDENGPLEDRHWKKARHFNNFTVELAELMCKAGREYAAYSFSTGNPNHLEIWKELESGVMASKYLALHEYIYPGENYDNPDMSMCLRHRLVYEALSPAAREHVKMIITECGADLHGVPGADGGGYKKNIGDEKYWLWMREYDKILLQDPYVLGATIYTYGANKDWVTYDISGSFANLMMNRIPALPDVPELVPPPPHGDRSAARRHAAAGRPRRAGRGNPAPGASARKGQGRNRQTASERGTRRARDSGADRQSVVLCFCAGTFDRSRKRAGAYHRALVQRRSDAAHRSEPIDRGARYLARQCAAVAGIGRTGQDRDFGDRRAEKEKGKTEKGADQETTGNPKSQGEQVQDDKSQGKISDGGAHAPPSFFLTKL